jgi:hypothetical protein
MLEAEKTVGFSRLFFLADCRSRGAVGRYLKRKRK